MEAEMDYLDLDVFEPDLLVGVDWESPLGLRWTLRMTIALWSSKRASLKLLQVRV